MARRDECIFRRARVYQYDVDVAILAQLERLAGADGDHMHLATTVLLELGQQVIEQTGIGGTGRRRQPDDSVIGRSAG